MKIGDNVLTFWLLSFCKIPYYAHSPQNYRFSLLLVKPVVEGRLDAWLGALDSSILFSPGDWYVQMGTGTWETANMCQTLCCAHLQDHRSTVSTATVGQAGRNQACYKQETDWWIVAESHNPFNLTIIAQLWNSVEISGRKLLFLPQ